MPYQIYFEERADKDLTFFKNDKKNLKKINDLIENTIQNPRVGIGKPERLKHKDGQEIYSRRTIGKHRMVYIIDDEKETITILSLHGHYEDK